MAQDFQKAGHLAREMFSGLRKHTPSSSPNDSPSKSRSSSTTGTQQPASTAESATGTEPSATGSDEHSTRPTRADIEQLFIRFEAVWGNKWVSRFTSEAVKQQALKEYYAELKDLPLVSIIEGYKLARRSRDWPPTPHDLRMFCKSRDPSLFNPVEYLNEVDVASPEVAEAAIEKCWQILGKTRRPKKSPQP